jgi:hypothetical protein
MPTVDQHVSSSNDTTVRRCDDGRVVAGTEEHVGTGFEAGNDSRDEAELPDVTDPVSTRNVAPPAWSASVLPVK